MCCKITAGARKGGFLNEDRNEDFETRRESSGKCYHLGCGNAGKERIVMSSDVETMFSVRVKPWHGIGTVIEECPNSREAIRLAGLDWKGDCQDYKKYSGRYLY